ncbi:MAG: hypothetical protein KIT33_09100 [Candidatus Kapabacteria bacterium]|nr:hypothetical protein [Ignavibacteriota bacterium]MCW5885114.1 hypothetical protein [Candidatus Kapabacteria bacterium]
MKTNILMKYLLPLLLLLLTYFSTAEESYKLESIFNYPNNLVNTMDMSCFDNNNCLMISTDYNSTGCMVYKTSDGGITWQTLYADSLVFREDSIYFPKSLAQRCKYFDDGTMIIVTSTGKILRSEDFGNTFDIIQIPDYSYQSFEMIDKNKAVTVSVKSDGKGEYGIYKSTDGCKTWEKFNVPDSISQIWNFNKIDIQRDSSMIIGCNTHYGISYDTNYRYYFHTDFDGSFWKLLTTLNKFRMTDFHFENENLGFATGSFVNMAVNDSAFFFKTIDGGKNWQIKLQMGGKYYLFYKPIFFNMNNILLGGSGFGFFKSTDQGESWFYPTFILDTNLMEGVYFFTLSEYFGDEFYAYTSLPSQLIKGKINHTSVELTSLKPKHLYPNPVTNGTIFTTEYEIEKSGNLRIYLSNINGNLICEFFSGFKDVGYHSQQFNITKNISSGSYWLVSEINGFSHIQMLNVIR